MLIFYYIYYNFYHLAKQNNSVFAPSFVSMVAILALELWLIGGLLNEFYYFSGTYLLPDNIYNLETAVVLITLVGINTYVFEFQDKGKQIIKYIENNKNRVMVRIAWIVVTVILINYWVLSIYLLSLKSFQVV